ncbi:putative groES-like protein [Lyophyllum shimeji]|uniref:GroES-like protein n=1 Tax=Lyophyllum shimeji TaxID=47721 RepID=A0A9P3PSD2_LYOSH|nr:putative groES-like protein [Lyophyllum shimeji]
MEFADGGFLSLLLPEKFKPVEGRNVTAAFAHGHLTLPTTRGLALHAHLTGLLEKGLIKPDRVEVLLGGLRGVVGGLERIKAGQASGIKLILRPQRPDTLASISFTCH